MKGRLSEPRKEYLFFHLGHHAVLSDEIRSLFRFPDNLPGDPGQGPDPASHYIFFPLSQEELIPEKIRRIDDVPVLYPVSQDDAWYSFSGRNLVFHHDLLKSSFHLLSGYQEYISEGQDQYGRFLYEDSIQNRLGITTTPVVNYYFETILEGIELFCRLNRLPFQRKTVFRGPVFFLSHDIDRVDAYHFYETGFKFKQLLGLEPSPYKRADRVRVAFSSLYHFLNPFSGKNPFWNFDFLTKTENDLGMRSTWFFLEKDSLHDDSRYRFHGKKIRELIHVLSSEGHEIGLHGTIRSAADQESMNLTLANLRKVSPAPVQGIRQHFLKYRLPLTALIQEKAGLSYDATLGYAEHEGFRHSYCWPYKLFDFQKERMIGVWEVPLNAMDVTLFYYRRLDFDRIMASVEQLTAETRKFSGIFSLLWHNHFFDELELPGITDFYLQLLGYLKARTDEVLTGRQIIARIESAGG